MTVPRPWAASRLAIRIARREALRYKGRSALSIALLGLPLLGVAVAASAYDTMQLSPEETAEQAVGANDAYVAAATAGTPIVQYSWDSRWPAYEAVDPGAASDTAATEADLLAALPEGSRAAPYLPDTNGATQVDVATPDGLGSIQSLGYDLTDDVYEASGLEFLEGEAPSGDKVALSAAAADYLELGVGDTLVVHHDATTAEHQITGIAEFPWNLNGRFAIGTVFPVPSGGWLVDAPGPLTHEQALALNEAGLTVWAPSLVNDPPPPPDGIEHYTGDPAAVDSELLTVYGLVAAVVVMEVVLLSGPAFAISAKRRTREFALMSANGATPAQIRAVVLAGGLLFGVIAAAAAVLVGIGFLAATLPLLERFVGHRSAGLQILPWVQAALAGVAIGTGLLSALAAAVSASRVNVVAALTGRAPRRHRSKRWMVIGLVAMGLGIASGLAGVAAGTLPFMVASLVLAQLGMVACTPALLALTARLGRGLRLAPRMAMREAGRNRGSAAPAIAAVLGVVAGGVAFSMTVTANAVRNEEQQEQILPQDTLTLTLLDYAGEGDAPDWEAALAETRPLLEARLDDLELTAVTEFSGWGGCGAVEAGEGETVECLWTLTRPEEHECPYWSADTGTIEAQEAALEAARGDARCDELAVPGSNGSSAIPGSTDPDVVAAYTDLEGAELDEAVALLETGGVLVADPWALSDQGTVVFQQEILTMDDSGGSQVPQETYLELPAMLVEQGQLGFAQTFLGPAAAERMGLVESPWQRLYLVETTTEVDSGDTEAFAAGFDREVAGGDVFARFAITDYRDPFASSLVLGVTGLCALIALGATAVSTGLIIAEQRRDMVTLAAVGAGPGLRKRFAMWQIIVIAVFGTALGTVAGMFGYALIREALNRSLQGQYPFQTLYGWELPWLSTGIILLAVPLLAAIGALGFTRANLPSERRLT
jgi:putative ABC transport system permease protein